MKEIRIQKNLQDRNRELAESNRKLFEQYRVFNLIGSPGCGKTLLLEQTARALKEKLAVIVGDVRTDMDAERIKAHGSQAVQIETGGACHLNAEVTAEAFKKLDRTGCKIIVIENVGNLVCPASFDLGEDAKIGMVSLPEGDEKPAKYPALFMRADAVVINKIDLKDVLDYDIDRVKKDCRKMNADVRLIDVSAKTGEGMDNWIAFLSEGTL